VIKCLIEEYHTSYLTQANNLDTPFLSACEYGHLDVVNYFLETTNGLNTLDVAIANHRENIVRK
jgi:ankyrin repeat protein